MRLRELEIRNALMQARATIEGMPLMAAEIFGVPSL
jgi:hypothetical protein